MVHLLPEANEMIATSVQHLKAPPFPTTNETIAAFLKASSVQLTSTLGETECESNADAFPWAMVLTAVSMVALFKLDVLFTRVLFQQNQHNHEKATKSSQHHSRKDGCCSLTTYSRIFSQSVLWLSLCIHSFSVALAFGVETSEVKVYTLYGAIISHHLIEAFSYGIILDNAIGVYAWWAHLFYIFTYAALLPIGIGLGMGISAVVKHDAFTLVQGIIMAIACGAFLYIAIFEVLMEHNHGSEIESSTAAQELMRLDEQQQKQSQQQVDLQDMINSPSNDQLHEEAGGNNKSSNVSAIVDSTAVTSATSPTSPDCIDTIRLPAMNNITAVSVNSSAKYSLLDKVVLTVRFSLFVLGFTSMTIVKIWV